jgi:mannosyltransferase OCH1-like enzyme
MVALIFFVLFGLYNTCLADFCYMGFDEAMRKDDFPHAFLVTENVMGIDGNQLYDFFKEGYEKNNPLVVPEGDELKIPKIIHQIWLGSPVPESFRSLQQSWIENHFGRDWFYKLWTDEDVEKMELYNQEFYDATDNYGVKSDILRWEIIHCYGGVYIDMDFESLQPLDELHQLYDFYVGIQPLDTFFVQLGAALFGARPGHPILKHCIETISDDWHLHGAPKKTGPVHFTKSFYAMAGKDNNRDIAFPGLYFYPLGSQETKADRTGWIKKGAFAVHWWAKSWMPKNYRPVQFRDIYNDFSAQSWND